MVRLIDADALRDYFHIGGDETSCKGCVHLKARGCYEERLLSDFCSAIDEQPTVDAVPVRHGKWIQVGHIEHMQIVYKCSACNGQTIVDGNYCPNCGARMDEE